jgi:DNA modification methylase
MPMQVATQKRNMHTTFQSGYIFACTKNTQDECFAHMLFSTNKIYAEKMLQVKKGDALFLYNVDIDKLYGVYRAKSEGRKNIIPEAWNGKYPYQVAVEPIGDIITLRNAKKVFSRMNIDWKNVMDKAVTNLLVDYLKNPEGFDWDKIQKIILRKQRADEKPTVEATTLWDYPKQSYGRIPKGNNKYPGVTPAFIIYNMIKRYTEPGDLVVDPMAGSGTTLDVCKEEGRKSICYDIAPTRADVIQNDARKIPLPDESVDMIFVDSPYGDNIRYNDHPDNIGRISAEKEEFYNELEKTMKECYRILKPGKVLGWLIGDQWVKKKFTPVGFIIYERLTKYFEPIDIVCVARRNQTSNTGIWYNRAIRFNFFLRGFKYLLLMRKPLKEKDFETTDQRKITWTHYQRE